MSLTVCWVHILPATAAIFSVVRVTLSFVALAMRSMYTAGDPEMWVPLQLLEQ